MYRFGNKFIVCILAVFAAAAATSTAFAMTAAATTFADAVTTIPTHYKALVGETTGTSFSDVATVKTLSVKDSLQIEADEVLIKVVYAGINGGCETFRTRGEFAFGANKQTNNHFGLGAEGVGIVEAIGSDVHNGIRVGQVVGFVNSAFSEYTKSKAKMVWSIPNASPEFVGLRISALTACAMLEKTGRITEGETMLVTAAAGAAGSFAVQFAKLAGCTVIATCGSDEKRKALEDLGCCDHIINYKKCDDLEAELKRIAPDGVDVVFEGVGGKMMRIALNVMKPKPSSRLLQVGYISEYPHNPDREKESSENDDIDCADLFWNAKTIVRDDGSTIYGNAWPKDNFMTTQEECKDRVLRLFDEGKLTSLVDEGSYKFQNGLDSVSDAVEYMLSGKAIGKVVVKIQ